MRLQTLFLLVVFAIIGGQQCTAENTATTTTSTSKMTTTERSTSTSRPTTSERSTSTSRPTTSERSTTTSSDMDDWSWQDNYLGDSEDEDMYDTKPRYRGKYDDDSYERRPSRKGYDDSYEKRPSRKGYDDDDNDDDYEKDDASYERRPSRPIKKPKEVAHMNIYFREPSKDGKRKKPKRFRFPVANYERKHFPRNFGPLISFMPWLPIFADRLTKQTIIYSPTGGVYILPPVINFYGKMISVAQLIASGYASLVSSGAPPPPAVDVRPLVQPGPVVGPGVPAINPATGGFKGGVRTDFRSLPRAQYPKTFEDKPAYPQRDAYAPPRVGY